MKKIPTFLSGMLTMALIGGLGVGALAATGAVTFNASNLMFNGQQISAKGEGYALDNGCQAPASITYTDEKGGGTTYLPVRRISELLGVETGWDGVTGSVTVGKAADAAAPSTDYSNWTAEEEAAYQEFKGMWEITVSGDGAHMCNVSAKYRGGLSREALGSVLRNSQNNIERLFFESTNNTTQATLSLYFEDTQVVNSTMLGGEIIVMDIN